MDYTYLSEIKPLRIPSVICIVLLGCGMQILPSITLPVLRQSHVGSGNNLGTMTAKNAMIVCLSG